VKHELPPEMLRKLYSWLKHQTKRKTEKRQSFKKEGEKEENKRKRELVHLSPTGILNQLDRCKQKWQTNKVGRN
jgi:hypothetical protein